MKATDILIFPFILIVSCNSCKDSNSSNPNTKQNEKEKAYPIQELTIANSEEEGWGADIRMSIIQIDSTTEMTIYKARSIYQGESLGMDIAVSKTNKNILTITGLGNESDHFLRTLAELYKIKGFNNKKFVSEIRVSYVNLIDFAKDQLGEIDTSGWIAPIEYKLFFQANADEEYAEIYLNINETAHWLEFREKDPEYRPMIINFLAKKEIN